MDLEKRSRLKSLLAVGSSLGVIKINPADSEGIIRILLALYHGMAIQLLTNPEKAKDKRI